MKHAQAKKHYLDYIEGVLEGNKLEAFEEHLHGCPLCRQEIEAMRQLQVRLQQEAPARRQETEPGHTFWPRLESTLRSLPELRRVPLRRHAAISWRRYAWAWATAVTAILVLAVLFGVPPVREGLFHSGKGPGGIPLAPATPVVTATKSASATLALTQTGAPTHVPSPTGGGQTLTETASTTTTSTTLAGLVTPATTTVLVTLPVPTPTPGATATPTPLILTINEPQLGAVVNNSSVFVVGRTAPGAWVTVNGRYVAVADDGSFALELSLVEGLNVIEILARTADGRENAVTLYNTYRNIYQP